jgi:hypothetical protein
MTLHASNQAAGLGHQPLYQSLLAEREGAAQASLTFLREQLEQASCLPCDMPTEPDALLAWTRAEALATSSRYQAYLAERRAGAPRRFFASRAQALWFLQAVAPTKLVDGAWLASVVSHWDDDRFRPLIQTYVEELGDGVQALNHVAVYQRLLDASGCGERDDLPDHYYTQGAIQLALAAHGNAFLPEVIGFNLGYEQLPLHLLITAHELDELGIDPWYFTLHVTIDNAATGHAEKAVRALHALFPQTGNAQEFFQRVRNGYRLNALGAGSEGIIRAFDLEREFLGALERKARLGAFMHADHCRIGGKSVTQWLGQAGGMREFLGALEKAGWIVHGRAPEESRFWNLLHGPNAPMFGVFSAYEQQLLREWIVGPAAVQDDAPRSFRARQLLRSRLSGSAPRQESRPRPILRDRFSQKRGIDAAGSELRELENRLHACRDQSACMALLLPLLRPGKHHSAPGLMATRIYRQLMT